MMNCWLRIMVLVGLCSCGWAAVAGTVYLHDGSVVNGEVLKLADGTLTVATGFAGEIGIDMAKVNGITTEQPVVVRFDSGDEVAGRLAFEPGGEQKLVETSFGAMAVDLGGFHGLRPPSAPSPEEVALAALRNDRWSGRLLLGVSGSSGNDESRDISFGAEARRESVGGRLYFKLYLDRGRDEGELTTDQTIATARLERDFSKRFFAFGQTQIERDEFGNVDFRSTTTIGPGYYFIMEQDQELKGRLGLGYEYVQPVTNTGRVSEAIATLGYDYMVAFWDGLEFTHEFTIIPRVSDDPVENFRIDSLLGLEAALGKQGSWSLLLQYRQEYDSDPEPTVESLDTSYLLNLVRKFE